MGVRIVVVVGEVVVVVVVVGIVFVGCVVMVVLLIFVMCVSLVMVGLLNSCFGVKCMLCLCVWVIICSMRIELLLSLKKLLLCLIFGVFSMVC